MVVKPAAVKRIRQLSKQGRSSNEIARQLRREGIGIRRKTLLAYVRRFKGRPLRPHAERYIPRKYRRRVASIPRPRHEKHVAIYGRVKGISKRIEVSGTGKGINIFLIDAVEHPPKRRFERISVKDYMGFSHRAKYLDYGERWDEKPTIKS